MEFSFSTFQNYIFSLIFGFLFHYETGLASQTKNHYFILGLENFAPIEDVKPAYRKLISQFHTDKLQSNSNSEQITHLNGIAQDLNQSYAILGNPERKRNYDEWLYHWISTQEKNISSRQTTDPDKNIKAFINLFQKLSDYSFTNKMLVAIDFLDHQFRLSSLNPTLSDYHSAGLRNSSSQLIAYISFIQKLWFRELPNMINSTEYSFSEISLTVEAMLMSSIAYLKLVQNVDQQAYDQVAYALRNSMLRRHVSLNVLSGTEENKNQQETFAKVLHFLKQSSEISWTLTDYKQSLRRANKCSWLFR